MMRIRIIRSIKLDNPCNTFQVGLFAEQQVATKNQKAIYSYQKSPNQIGHQFKSIAGVF